MADYGGRGGSMADGSWLVRCGFFLKLSGMESLKQKSTSLYVTDSNMTMLENHS